MDLSEEDEFFGGSTWLPHNATFYPHPTDPVLANMTPEEYEEDYDAYLANLSYAEKVCHNVSQEQVTNSRDFPDFDRNFSYWLFSLSLILTHFLSKLHQTLSRCQAVAIHIGSLSFEVF